MDCNEKNEDVEIDSGEKNEDIEMLKALIHSECNDGLDYSMSQKFAEFDLIKHPKFGFGFVKEHLSSDKMLVVFEDRERILLMNYSK